MIQGILLAAGRSQRFGADKRLAPVDGLPMVVQTALHWREALGDRLLVVLRAADDDLAGLLDAAGVATTHCPLAALGMGHSLAHGVACTARADGWVIGLADMPRLRAASIGAVADALAPGRIVVPMHGGVRGHPVGFDAAFGAELRALHGDAGARNVLRAHPQALHVLELDDPGVLFDVDRPEQLPD